MAVDASSSDGSEMRSELLRHAVSFVGRARGRAYSIYEKRLKEEIATRKLPEHVAIIMDGNRRYARKLGLSTDEGYDYGAGITERVIEWCFEYGVKQLTLYAFSIENFSRTEDELEKLFTLMRTEFDKICVDERFHRNEVRVRVIGNIGMLPESVRAAIGRAEAATEQYDKFKLFVAMAYSGRMEIVDAMRIIGHRVQRGLLAPEEIDEATIAQHLYISQIEDEADVASSGAKTAVDLIIRTGGELRISNFVPWEALGSECTAYFCAPFWPEFRRLDLLRAIRTYQEREDERVRRSHTRFSTFRRLFGRDTRSSGR